MARYTVKWKKCKIIYIERGGIYTKLKKSHFFKGAELEGGGAGKFHISLCFFLEGVFLSFTSKMCYVGLLTTVKKKVFHVFYLFMY